MGWLAILGMGFVLGALGGGGGILTVPILVGLFGLPVTEATGSSLLIVGAASSIGTVQGLLSKKVDWKAGILIAIPSAIGAYASRLVLVPLIPKTILGVAKDDILLVAFATLMVIVGMRMLRPTDPETTSGSSPLNILIVGLFIGVISGTLGAGGGFLILPALTLLAGVELDRAIPTSLMVICLQSLTGFAGELGKQVPWGFLGRVVAFAILGLVLGLVLRERVPKKALRASFVALVFVVAAWLFVKAAF